MHVLHPSLFTATAGAVGGSWLARWPSTNNRRKKLSHDAYEKAQDGFIAGVRTTMGFLRLFEC